MLSYYDPILLSSGRPLAAIDKQFNFVSLSQAMIKGAKLLEGAELAMLNKAYSKYFSKTPQSYKLMTGKYPH
jgi:hypothetical protein